jgi:hypothetical protein
MAKALLMFDPEDISAVASETAVNKLEFPAEHYTVQKKAPRRASAL